MNKKIIAIITGAVVAGSGIIPIQVIANSEGNEIEYDGYTVISDTEELEEMTGQDVVDVECSSEKEGKDSTTTYEYALEDGSTETVTINVTNYTDTPIEVEEVEDKVVDIEGFEVSSNYKEIEELTGLDVIDIEEMLVSDIVTFDYTLEDDTDVTERIEINKSANSTSTSGRAEVTKYVDAQYYLACLHGTFDWMGGKVMLESPYTSPNLIGQKSSVCYDKSVEVNTANYGKYAKEPAYIIVRFKVKDLNGKARYGGKVRSAKSQCTNSGKIK